MAEIGIGSNRFVNVFIPLEIDGRYFLVENEGGNDLWTVVSFPEGKPTFEILKNRPQENPFTIVETNATGILTVGDRKTGDFLYKIRPGKKDSAIFGKIEGEETEIKIRDRFIEIGGARLKENVVFGSPIGIAIRGGHVIMGGGAPPPEVVALLTGRELVTEKPFSGERVLLDGKFFVGCTFTRCTLVFSASDRGFGAVGCTFNECQWTFEGAAQRTVDFMRFMYGKGPFEKRLIEEIIDFIRASG